MDRVKGISLLRNTEYIALTYGPEALEELCETLRPDTAKVMREGALKSTWYDVEIYFDQLRGIAARFGGESPSEIMREMGANSAELDLGSVYRFFLRFGSPGFVISSSAIMWKNYYDGGRLDVTERASDYVLTRLLDERTLPPHTCNLIIGWAARAIALSGGKDVMIAHPDCRAGGHSFCDFKVRWR